MKSLLTNRVKALCAAAAVVIGGAGPASALTDLMVNGGFETGDLTGWTTGGDTSTVSVVTSDTIPSPTGTVINPFAGNYFAKRSTIVAAAGQ